MDLLSVLNQFTDEPNSILYLYVLCFMSVLFVFKLTTKRSKLNLPPSPPKLPIIGNIHQLGKLSHRSLRSLSQKHGPLMLLQLGQTPLLVVSSADMCKEIGNVHDVSFSNRFETAAAKIFFYGRKDVAFAPYGDEWRQKKKVCVLELLSQKRVRSFSPIVQEEVVELVNTIREACTGKRSSINLSQMLIEISNDIISRCVLGRKYDSHSNFRVLGRKMVNQFAAIYVGDLFPSLGWVDVLTGKIPQSKTTFAALDAFFDEVIAEHRRSDKKENDQSDNKDFVEILLQLQESGMLKFDLTQESIKAIVMDMFVGGADTAASGLEWAFAELVRNPSIMKKAQEEVRRVVGSKPKIDENDLNQMTYLKCVIKESFRLHPPVPLVVRKQVSGVKLKGYDIPPKTMVFFNAWTIQRDPELWENSEEFIPERFESNHVDLKGQDFQIISFGLGRRGCPGYSFGLAFIEYILANLLYWFDWKLPGTDSSMEDLDMDEMVALTLNKKEPLLLEPILHSFGPNLNLGIP